MGTQISPDLRPPATGSSDLSDEQAERLLLRCADRDEAALESLYRLVAPRVLACLLGILRRRELAEDVLQDVFVSVWERAGQFDQRRGRALAWLYSIARNRAIDVLRKRRSSSAVEGVDLEQIEDPSDTPVDERESARSVSALEECLQRLTELQRRCMRLAYVQGLSQEEIAASTGNPLGTVKSWLRRGLLALRECLEA
jgi:RNA polymerase sigma-70 factor (ECF subfamily)